MLVLAVVREGRQELPDEVRVRTVHLDAMEAAVPGAPGGRGEQRTDELGDLAARHRDRGDVDLRADQARRRPGRAPVGRQGMHAPVPQLLEDPHRVALELAHQLAIAVDDAVVPRRDPHPRRRRGVDGGELQDRQPDTAARTRDVVGDEVVADSAEREAGRVRGAHDAVRHDDVSDRERHEDAFVRHRLRRTRGQRRNAHHATIRRRPVPVNRQLTVNCRQSYTCWMLLSETSETLQPSESLQPPAQTPALAGIRVLEVGTLIAGPFAGRLLADMGAEVIKLEAPDAPDPIRDWGHGRYHGKTLWWPVISRNKRLATLNLRKLEGQALFLRLVEHADVVVENFRPGTLERWNLGYKRLASVNPRIILARISGYGQDGPYAGRAGFAAVAEAVSGLRYLNGFPDRPPPRLGISLGDSLAGMFAFQGILSALYWRDAKRGGLGQIVDVALTESCLALLENVPLEYELLGLVREPAGLRLDTIAPSNIFRSADAHWVVIAANQDSLFARLAAAIDQPELARDERFLTHEARARNVDELEAIIAHWVAERPAADVVALLNKHGVPTGPVNSIDQVMEDAQFRAREAFVEVDDPELGKYHLPAIVPRLSRTPGRIVWPAPWAVGADNDFVYRQLAGLDAQTCTRLEEQGVI